MDRALPDFLLGVGGDRDDFLAVIKPAKRNPHILPMPRNCGGCVPKPDLVQESDGVDANADSGADLLVLRGLLIDADLHVAATEMVQEERGQETSNASAHNGNAEGWYLS